MNKHSRTTNTIYNLIGNFIYQFVILILAFATRRVFIGSLGAEYLGINGLFNNIITVLSLAELGIGNALYYSMYRQIANNNKEQLSALTAYYKTLYNRIAIAVFIIGICFIPVLRLIVNLESEMPHLEIYYLISLISSATSYLFVYKTSIINADQSGYIIKWLNIIIQVFKAIVGILILRFIKNYLVYITVEVLIGIIGNYVCSKYAEKLYPFIKNKNELEKEEKKKIWSNIKDMFFYKFSGVILNNTDNIIISVLCGTSMVGFYSNYLMIYNKISSISSIIFDSFNSSIGNLNVVASNERKYEIFKTISFLSFWIFSIACIGVYFVGEDVIRIMSGKEMYILEKSILIITLLVFYLKVTKHPILLYRDTTGLFMLCKYSILASAILNIALSIIFGKLYGLFGIILATLVSRLLCDVWYEPYILYSKIFHKKVRYYYLEQMGYILLTIVLIFILTPLIGLINIDNLYIRATIEFMICLIIPNIIYLIIFHKNKDFIYLRDKVFEVLKKILRGNKKIEETCKN